MKTRRQRSSYLLGAILVGFMQQPAAIAQNDTTHPDSGSATHQAAPPHDGRHDFDFELGKWHAHLRYLLHRLAGSNEWEDFDGTVVTTPFMDGKGNLTEMNVVGATSHRNIRNIAVRLYNTTSHQWSIYGADDKSAVFDPPQIGQFDGNRGEFYASDIYQGRQVYIRFVWQNLGPMRTHFEQAFSADGGKTWEVNWIYDGTRMTAAASQ